MMMCLVDHAKGLDFVMKVIGSLKQCNFVFGVAAV